MVRHFFPQGGNKSINANTNYPPQSTKTVTMGAIGVMQYEDLASMQYEDLEDMEYES